MTDGSNTIGIIDYGMGNLRSVQKAFELLGARASVLTEPARIADVGSLVLPGVGAFADGMEHLTRMRWVDPILAHIESDRPFLGICLGMQLLFQGSEEDAASIDEPVPGLAVLPGKVVGFVQPTDPELRIKIPHMGWNSLGFHRDDPLFAGIEDEAHVYFVHGYYAEPDESDQPLGSATTEYPPSRPFCASIWRGRVWATQFHPEKSQRVGLKMLANFVGLDS